ncbi:MULTISPECIES: hypothetical protein [unclassified Nocardiopsis]|uniref:hypothetical protein n=1 Tax=Nocardiopsis TaxID=2013 RepID=UPI00387B7EA6
MGTTPMPYTPACPPDRRGALLRIRRYAVPRSMIERATERRLAGDWRGACAAAGMDLAFDPDRVRGEYGAEFARALLDDLRHLVPDLVRWHYPRREVFEHTDLHHTVFPVLSRPGGAEGPWLTVHFRGSLGRDPQRLLLRLSRVPEPGTEVGERTTFWKSSRLWTASRYLWDSRHVHETRERWGGGAERAPFLNPDGTPRSADEIPAEDPGHDDPAARTEWIDALYGAGRVEEAFTAAGIDPSPYLLFAAENRHRQPWPPLSVALLAREAGHLAAVEPAARRALSLRHLGDLVTEGGRLRLVAHDRNGPQPPGVTGERPLDVDVLRLGMSPDHLHPAVRDALAPARPPADGPVGPPPWEPVEPVRVRCGGEWHTLAFRGGRLTGPHTEEEHDRERSLRAFGGRSTGCFAARETWTAGHGWLPRALRARRVELFERILHGDTGAVLAYLDAGGDPHVRDGDGRTLLHHLAHLDHEALLPRLLAAGLDPDGEDLNRQAPLCHLARFDGTVPLLRALISAGARTDGLRGISGGPHTLARVLRHHGKRSLRPGNDTAEREALLAELEEPDRP